ncbi:TetR/AcrR family transcriptional regulator [Ilumatobacter sp.]|uniref:TetR/AcrR family transcriptional regulator n=1 Tax=Ilumatobacter sp. TaxID=1967498 RepID=UPI003C3BCCE0
MADSSEPGKRLDVDSPQGNAIVEAATRCFDTWGVERTRMGDIAIEADVARPTLYRYFPNKEALILEVMIRHIRVENAMTRKKVKLAGPGRDVIRRCLLLQIREQRPKEQPGSLLRTESTHVLAHRAANSPEVLEAAKELWADIFAYAAERGELRPDLEADGAIRWMTMLVHVSLVLPELMPADEQLERYLDQFVVEALVL